MECINIYPIHYIPNKIKWGTNVDYTINENALRLYYIVYTFGKSSYLNTNSQSQMLVFSFQITFSFVEENPFKICWFITRS